LSAGQDPFAVATSVSEIVVAVWFPIIVIRRNPQLRPSLAVVPKVLLAGGAAAALAALPLGPNAVQATIQLALFVVLLLVTRAVPRELLDAIRR